jgi:hypothetical protein
MRRPTIVAAFVVLVAGCGTGDEEVVAPPRTAPFAATTTATTSPPTTTTPDTAPVTIAPTTSATTTTSTTTTTLPDTTPPPLAVTWPGSGEHLGERVITFAGTTEPGAQVLGAGRYEADVDEAGTWSLRLVLNAGSNVATFTAADAAGNATEVQHTVFYDPPLVLRPDGLGTLTFDQPEGAVTAALTELLGPPDGVRTVTTESLAAEHGEGMIGPFMATGYGAVNYIRFVTWDDVRLTVIFSDYNPSLGWTSVDPHFVGYSLGRTRSPGSTLRTSDGLGLDSGAAEWAAHHELFMWEFEDAWAEGFSAVTSTPSPWWPGETMAFNVTLDRDVADPAAVVLEIAAGFARDTC